MIFSPPFSSLYTYSASSVIMGNCRGEAEFFRALSISVAGVDACAKTRPADVDSLHATCHEARHHRVIGLYDFRGDLFAIIKLTA